MDIDTPNLDLVEDDFAEGEHATLDVELGDFSSALTPDNVDLFAPYVLDAIVTQLGDRANPRYAINDLKRLAERPGLREMLLQGSRDGYHLVRRLKILRKDVQVESKRSIFPPDTARAAQRAWNSEFRGKYHEIMLENINKMNRSENHVNCAALIQSSGCGKSRMVDEMAKLVFTIPINLRNPGERAQGAWPPEDRTIRDFLCCSKLSSVDDGEALTALFFRFLFAEVRKEVEQVFSQKPRLQPRAFALEWWKHLSKAGRNRAHLYESVVQACREHPPGSRRWDESAMSDVVYWLLATLNKFCDSPEPGDVKIVLYFDEAHELDKPIPNSEKKLYDIVWSTLHAFKSASIFTVFLSTYPHLTLLAPSVEMAPSMGMSRSSRQQSTAILQAPITETPFDCHPSLPLRPGQYGLADLEKLEFLTRFGRPLFWTMLDKLNTDVANENATSKLLAVMMNMAREKLLLNHEINAMEEVNRVEMSVILDVLISIDYEPGRVLARERQSEMVASHMRIAFSIPEHRAYIRSGYPSEPFLAEAASRQMYHYMARIPRFSMAKVLRNNLKDGLIDLGQKGEVVMRLLLRKAYMDAIVAEQRVQGDTSPNFSKGCSLRGFLTALFPDRFHSSVLECKPANNVTTPQTVAKAFENAVVRFTHFVKAADGDGMSTRCMTMGFLRGSAIVGYSGQQAIDIAIPILLDKDHKIEEASMSAFLVQVKRRKKAGSHNAYLMDEKRIGFFPEAQGPTKDQRPYMTVVAELAVKTPAGKTPVIAIQSGTRASERIASYSTPEHPRYFIEAYGCTDTTWRVIHSDEHGFYAQILSIDTLLGDHPRQDADSLWLVRRMLPYWYRDTEWFDDGKLAEDPESEQEEDSMMVDSQ